MENVLLTRNTEAKTHTIQIKPLHKMTAEASWEKELSIANGLPTLCGEWQIHEKIPITLVWEVKVEF